MIRMSDPDDLQLSALRRQFPKVGGPETMGTDRREYTHFLTTLAATIERATIEHQTG